MNMDSFAISDGNHTKLFSIQEPFTCRGEVQGEIIAFDASGARFVVRESLRLILVDVSCLSKICTVPMQQQNWSSRNIHFWGKFSADNSHFAFASRVSVTCIDLAPLSGRPDSSHSSHSFLPRIVYSKVEERTRWGSVEHPMGFVGFFEDGSRFACWHGGYDGRGGDVMSVNRLTDGEELQRIHTWQWIRRYQEEEWCLGCYQNLVMQAGTNSSKKQLQLTYFQLDTGQQSVLAIPLPKKFKSAPVSVNFGCMDTKAVVYFANNSVGCWDLHTAQNYFLMQSTRPPHPFEKQVFSSLTCNDSLVIINFKQRRSAQVATTALAPEEETEEFVYEVQLMSLATAEVTATFEVTSSTHLKSGILCAQLRNSVVLL